MKEQTRERASIRGQNPTRGQRQRLLEPVLVQTTMSSSLPPEILDDTLDHLYDEPATLKACCVVSKSWIPRTRKHLFASVEFYGPDSHIELWKKAFPDPSNSPAHYTRSLSVRGIPAITAADADEGGWIRTFHNLVHLHLEVLGVEDELESLVPFHGLSPTLRSLRLVSTSPEVLDLICSFPLLEDLTFRPIGYETDTWNTPSTSPKLTGTLNLDTIGEARPVIHHLLDLPGGLHFTKITVASFDADVESTTELVSRCSDTLESLSIYDYFLCTFPTTSMSGEYLTTTRGSRHV
jgi:hypothetical protein